MNLHVRITKSFNELENWITVEDCSQCVVYEHESDNEVSRTHCHIWLKNITCNTDTLKNHIRKVVGKVDKSDWAFMEMNKKNKTLWTDDVITYMSKGVLKPKYVKGFTDDEIEEYKSKWISPLSVVDGKLVLKKEVKEPKNKTQRELLQEMLDLYTEDMDTHEIVELVRKILVKNNIMMSMYKVMDYHDSILAYGSKDSFVKMITQKINSRIKI